jgi:hypothetical protein
MTEASDNGIPLASIVDVYPYNTYGLATQGFVWSVVSAVSGDFGTVKSVNSNLPDVSGNVDVDSIVSDNGGIRREIHSDLTVLSGDDVHHLLIEADLDELDGRIENVENWIGEASDEMEAIRSLGGDIVSTYSTVEGCSSGWESSSSKAENAYNLSIQSNQYAKNAYDMAAEISLGWDEVSGKSDIAYSTVGAITGDVDSVYTSVENASSGWSDAEAKILTSSAD